MAQYLVRKGKVNYELAKFDDSADVLEIYTYPRGCNCPSRSKHCKHSKILTAWEKADKQLGLVFDDEANIIGNLFV
jgi:hypothetical protein